jgi:dGTP triphosphohydrolase
VSNLTGWIAAEPLRLLPPDRREEFQEFGDEIRSAADYVSSMTEAQAVAMHRRMSGVDYGQITDLL